MPDQGEFADEYAAVVEIAEGFTQLVDALTAGASVDLDSDSVVELAARVVPRADHVGLVVSERGVVRTVAGNDDLLSRLDAIRAATGEGPGLDVLDVNDLAVSGDLAADAQWPQFGPRVVEELGVRSIAAYRLYLGPDHRAALVVTSSWPHAFDDLTLAVGAIFAAYCSLCLLTSLVLGDQLRGRRAVQVHREIGIAVGILTATGDIPVDHAYHRLRHASRHLHRSLHDVARHVTEHGSLPGAH